jgi:hypothetical protein
LLLVLLPCWNTKTANQDKNWQHNPSLLLLLLASFPLHVSWWASDELWAVKVWGDETCRQKVMGKGWNELWRIHISTYYCAVLRTKYIKFLSTWKSGSLKTGLFSPFMFSVATSAADTDTWLGTPEPSLVHCPNLQVAARKASITPKGSPGTCIRMCRVLCCSCVERQILFSKSKISW